MFIQKFKTNNVCYLGVDLGVVGLGAVTLGGECSCQWSSLVFFFKKNHREILTKILSPNDPSRKKGTCIFCTYAKYPPPAGPLSLGNYFLAAGRR